jgi:UDP-N-acetyl-D-mannosaminuronate dehydrogenase
MIKKGKAVVCSTGLGYVDMPLANAFVIENKQISVNPC